MNNDITTDLMSVSVDNGKYTVVQSADGRLKALRYGEEWQDLTGNNLVATLAAELEEARKVKLQSLAEAITEYAKEDLEQALGLLGGIFVGLNEVYVANNSDDERAKMDIVITGGVGQRKVTIHRAED